MTSETAAVMNEPCSSSTSRSTARNGPTHRLHGRGGRADGAGKVEDCSTPDGEPFWGGTYFPPEPRHGIPAPSATSCAWCTRYRDRRPETTGRRALTEAVGRSSDLRVQRSAHACAVGRGGPQPPRRLRRAARAAGAGRRSSRTRRRSSCSCAGATRSRCGWPGRRSMPWRPAACTTSWAAGSTATGWTRSARAALREHALRQRAPCCDVPARVGGHPGRAGTSRGGRGHARLRPARACAARGRLASAQDADTDGVEGLTFTADSEELADALGTRREELLQPFEHGRSIVRGELTVEERARLLAVRGTGRSPARRQGDRRLERPGAGRARGGRAPARPRGLRRARGVAEFLLGLREPDGRLGRSRCEGRTSGVGYLEDYADVAHGLLELHAATGEARWLLEYEPARAARGRALRRRGAWRLLPLGLRRRAALRARESTCRITRPPGNFDARPRPAAHRAALGRRRARAAGRRRSAARPGPGRARAERAFGWALCALDLYLAAPRELAVLGATARRGRSRGAGGLAAAGGRRVRRR